jgi:hypothetical protein
MVITVNAGDGVVRASVGPFAAGSLDSLDRDDSPLGLRRVLETVCDSYEVEERNGSSWVELSKKAAV